MKFTLNNLYQRQRGFTLIEVMIALVILTVGLLGLASLQMSAIKGNHLSDNITSALTLAEDKMEELLGLDYDNNDLKDIFEENNNHLGVIDYGSVDKEEHNINEAGKANSGHFRRIWNVADDMPIEGNKTIKVIVTWDNDNHQVSLTSVKRR